MRLAYSWASPAVLTAGVGKGLVFISSISSLFLHCPSLFPHSHLSPLSSILLFIFPFSPFLWETTQNDP